MSDEECTTIDNVRTCLSRGESIGAALNAESGLISLGAICILVILIIRNVYRNSKRPPEEQRSLVQEPADILMLSLFTADLLQGIGAALSIRWAKHGFVEIGRFCTTQGAIQQIGETAVAMTTLSIALQTFVAVWFRKFVHNRKLAIAVVTFIWLYVALFTGIAAGVKGGTEYFAPTPFWCWIGDRYPKERIFGEYLWLWLALFGSILVYVPLFLWANGLLSVGKKRWWQISLHLRRRASTEEETDARDRPGSLSLAILAYPVIYSILILPLTICRWISFTNPGRINAAATFAVIFIFGLSGMCNVILLLWTRPNLLLFDSEPCYSSTGQDVEQRIGGGGGSTPASPTTPTSRTHAHGRGRTVRRRHHSEKGRMVTPSRSSSHLSHTNTHTWSHRPSQEEFDDEFELGTRKYHNGNGTLAHDRDTTFIADTELGDLSQGRRNSSAFGEVRVKHVYGDDGDVIRDSESITMSQPSTYRLAR